MSRAKRKRGQTFTKMPRFRSSCTCAKYHPGLCSPSIHFKVSNDFVRGQWRPWSDCAEAQADLGLCYPHMPEEMFSHGATYMLMISLISQLIIVTIVKRINLIQLHVWNQNNGKLNLYQNNNAASHKTHRVTWSAELCLATNTLLNTMSSLILEIHIWNDNPHTHTHMHMHREIRGEFNKFVELGV